MSHLSLTVGAQAGVHRTSVIRNGQMLGVAEQRSRGAVSSGSMQLLGEAKLQLFYNDGNNARARARLHMALAGPAYCVFVKWDCSVVQRNAWCVPCGPWPGLPALSAKQGRWAAQRCGVVTAA